MFSFLRNGNKFFCSYNWKNTVNSNLIEICILRCYFRVGQIHIFITVYHRSIVTYVLANL